MDGWTDGQIDEYNERKGIKGGLHGGEESVEKNEKCRRERNIWEIKSRS